jgi:hypothetical protein
MIAEDKHQVSLEEQTAQTKSTNRSPKKFTKRFTPRLAYTSDVRRIFQNQDHKSALELFLLDRVQLLLAKNNLINKVLTLSEKNYI